jgi:hypothetical protein
MARQQSIRAQMPKLPALAKISPKPQRIRPGEGPLRLRLGGALQPREEGFLGVDCVPSDSVDYLVNIRKFPWPIDDSIVDTIFIADYMQDFPGEERISFMNECGRILKIGSQLVVKVPHWSSMRSISDPMVAWPPLCEASFVYFNKDWRTNEESTTESRVISTSAMVLD